MNIATEGTDNISAASSIASMLAPLLNLYRQNIDKMVQPYGISAWQTPVVNYLYIKDGQTQKELAQKMGTKPSSITSMLTRMESSGIVTRRQNENDKRAMNIYLTDKGRRAARKLGAIVRFIDERNLAGFMIEEKILLKRLMEQMLNNMQKQHEELQLIKQDEMLLQEHRGRLLE